MCLCTEFLLENGCTRLHSVSPQWGVCDDTRRELPSFPNGASEVFVWRTFKDDSARQAKVSSTLWQSKVEVTMLASSTYTHAFWFYNILLIPQWLFLISPGSWRSFKHQMLIMRSHSDSKGFELKRSSDSIYIFPCPDCMCRRNRTTATTWYIVARDSGIWSHCLVSLYW